jgi:CheY-like chemotaxis protein
MLSPPDIVKLGTLDVVLVVEDEVLIRMAICGYLRDCGYRVFEAANAAEALAVLQKADVEIDVVLSDIEMPGSMDGFSLARWIRENRPGLEVVLVGTPERAANAAGELCEEGPTLAKPYEPQILVDRIKQLLAARARRSGSRGATED